MTETSSNMSGKTEVQQESKESGKRKEDPTDSFYDYL